MSVHIFPHWMPDSKRVVFSRRLGNQSDTDGVLYVADISGGGPQELFPAGSPASKISHSFPTISPQGSLAFCTNSGYNGSRVQVANFDGTGFEEASPGDLSVDLQNDGRITPIEQKVPQWSPDGKSIAHWEGVSQMYLSQHTGIPDPERDQLIFATWNVVVVDVATGERRKTGHGDDPQWTPDGQVCRAFGDPSIGKIRVLCEEADGTWEDLPLLPDRTTGWGGFNWKQPSVADFIA